jgi:hypothetical protein
MKHIAVLLAEQNNDSINLDQSGEDRQDANHHDGWWCLHGVERMLTNNAVTQLIRMAASFYIHHYIQIASWR